MHETTTSLEVADHLSNADARKPNVVTSLRGATALFLARVVFAALLPLTLIAAALLGLRTPVQLLVFAAMAATNFFLCSHSRPSYRLALVLGVASGALFTGLAAAQQLSSDFQSLDTRAFDSIRYLIATSFLVLLTFAVLANRPSLRIHIREPSTHHRSHLHPWRRAVSLLALTYVIPVATRASWMLFVRGAPRHLQPSHFSAQAVGLAGYYFLFAAINALSLTNLWTPAHARRMKVAASALLIWETASLVLYSIPGLISFRDLKTLVFLNDVRQTMAFLLGLVIARSIHRQLAGNHSHLWTLAITLSAAIVVLPLLPLAASAVFQSIGRPLGDTQWLTVVAVGCSILTLSTVALAFRSLVLDLHLHAIGHPPPLPSTTEMTNEAKPPTRSESSPNRNYSDAELESMTDEELDRIAD